MYKSPIDIIYGNLQTQLEGEVLRAVQSVGVNVDKDELLKALAYDRQQYEKGYADAKEEYQRPTGRWVNGRILVGGFAEILGFDCSVCGKTVKDHKYNYCPNCGADMRGE